MFLRHVAIHCRSRIAPGLEFFGELRRCGLGAYKHQNSIEGFNFEYPRQCVEFVEATHLPVTLPNSLRRCGACLD